MMTSFGNRAKKTLDYIKEDQKELISLMAVLLISLLLSERIPAIVAILGLLTWPLRVWWRKRGRSNG
tara:strand:+ start:165 stop:365 length:201 start_codon:yes stop_codon:yes gene_type:complete